MQNKTASLADCYTYVIYDNRLSVVSEMFYTWGLFDEYLEEHSIYTPSPRITVSRPGPLLVFLNAKKG